ncbi:MAG: RNA methyltransferase [Phycisphaerales bacterium]|nr:RNA methyltransferase [Phycisphaerales bacterium]
MPTRILSLVQPVSITDPDDPRVALYRDVRDRDLQSRAGLFMAEGRFVVAMVLAQTRFTPHSVLVTEPALQSIESTLKSIDDATPVYLASQEVMDAITGFHIHRGCLAAVHRGNPLDAGNLIKKARTPDECLVVLEDAANHDNVGAVFRSAAAFGVGAVLLTAKSCDPLYRKAVRVSMGGVLHIPFARIDSAADAARALRAAGITTIALTPALDAFDIADAPRAHRVALFIGAEGPGLTPATIDACDLRVRVPTTDLVDSLNLSVAAGIAMHALAPLPLRSRA